MSNRALAEAIDKVLTGKPFSQDSERDSIAAMVVMRAPFAYRVLPVFSLESLLEESTQQIHEALNIGGFEVTIYLLFPFDQFEGRFEVFKAIPYTEFLERKIQSVKREVFRDWVLSLLACLGVAHAG